MKLNFNRALQFPIIEGFETNALGNNKAITETLEYKLIRRPRTLTPNGFSKDLNFLR